jgi:hypothetical protein
VSRSLNITYRCENQWGIFDVTEEMKAKKSNGTYIPKGDDQSIKLFVFSEKIIASFLAGYSVMSFYFGVILTVGTLLRPILIFVTPRAFIYEINHPEALLKLCELIH